MKIITKGEKKDEDTVIFECKNCGCVFEACKDEYYVDKRYLSDCITVSNMTYFDVFANCPECHKMCQSKKEKKAPPLSASYYSTPCDNKNNCTVSWQTSTTIGGENNNSTLTGDNNE